MDETRPKTLAYRVGFWGIPLLVIGLPAVILAASLVLGVWP